MCLYSCQYVRSKMVGRIAGKCARTVKSTVCYTGMHPLCLNIKWCIAFSARYLKREVLKYLFILRFRNGSYTKLVSTLIVHRCFWSTFLPFFGLDMPPVQHGDFPSLLLINVSFFWMTRVKYQVVFPKGHCRCLRSELPAPVELILAVFPYLSRTVLLTSWPCGWTTDKNSHLHALWMLLTILFPQACISH